RGQKGDLYEGGHRVPAIANWPNQIAEKSVTDATTMTMDLAPTFASLAGIEFQGRKEILFDGKDISLVLLKNQDLEERLLFWRFPNPYANSMAYAVRQSGWKYLVKDDQRFLFNLDMDQTESHNLIDRYPEKAEQLETEYKKWVEDVKE